MLNVSETQKMFQEKGIKYFMMSFVDLNGTPRAKLVPAECLSDVAEGAAGFAGFAVDGVGQGPHDPDLSCVPKSDSSVFPLPWKPGLAWIAGNLQMDGTDWEYCPRSILSRTTERAREMGFTFMLGVEPEFFLIDKKADGTPSIADPADTLDKPCYSQLSLLRNADFLTTIISHLNELGYGVYQNDHEDANGQFEINWRYADAMTTADQVSFFKFMVKALAEERGLGATFMPKPFSDLTGNGAHMHISLWDVEARDNLFLDKNDTHGLSSLAYAFIGGVVAHAKGLCALTAPSVNSYKRLGARCPNSGATWAPVFITHGGNNRTMMIRVPAAGRFEYRTADSSANPYLAATGILAAGLDGIEKGLQSGARREGNLFEMSRQQALDAGINLLPSNLGEALDELERDEVLCDALGSDYAQIYLQTKRAEWNEYSDMIAKSVTSWEWKKYLSL
ncbi:MAG TPA: type III glutamate--ammonia ligase [Abditibacteriaceae bacterium]|jgi:glutamine synthetase